MSTLLIEKLLDPASIVIVGASARHGSTGHALTQNVLGGSYAGELFLVNPRYDTVLGKPCHKSIKSLPDTPDLAIINVPSRLLRRTLVQCARNGILTAVVLTGTAKAQRLHRDAQRLGMRLMGPYCAGLIRPHLGLNATYSTNKIHKGNLAIVSESASLGAAMLDWAETSNVGFSALLSTGQDTDISLSDILDLLAEDIHTRAVIVYVEHINTTRSFLSALSATARIKPVVLMRSSYQGVSFCNTLTRSGEQYNSDHAFQAALNRTGVVRIKTFFNLYAAARILSTGTRVKGDRIAIISNANAPALMALEKIHNKGFQAPQLQKEMLSELNNRGKLNITGSNPLLVREPLELAEHFQRCLQTLSGLAELDALLLIFVPDSRNDATAIAQAVADCKSLKIPLLTCFMGDASVIEARDILAQAGIPNFRAPESATDGFDFLHRYFVSQQQLLQLPNPSSRRTPADLPGARSVVRASLESNQRVMSGENTERFMKYFDIPMHTAGLSDYTSKPSDNDARALTLSIVRDPLFGPVICVGIGNQFNAMFHNTIVQLPPLNRYLIGEILCNTDLQRYIGTYRHLPAIDTKPLAAVLRRLSEIACEIPEVFSLDINPLVLHEKKVTAGEVQIVLEHAPHQQRYKHLAIHPYPWQWVRDVTLKDNSSVQLRPIRPEDASSLQLMVGQMSAQARYFRFMHAVNELSPKLIAQFTKLDYDRQIAFVATPDTLDERDGTQKVIGVSRYTISNNRLSGEFAIAISDEHSGKGLATLLMKILIEHARSQGLRSIHGDVLRDNTPMKGLMNSLGFQLRNHPQDREIVIYSLDLERTSS